MKTLQIFLILFTIVPNLGLSSNNYLTRKIKLSYKDRSTIIHLHYPESKKVLADKVESISKNNFAQIHERFDYIPRSSTHIVINESANTSNGSATPFPLNTIFLNDYPPHKYSSLSNSDDWEKILVVHEYVHILTLEMTHGLRDVLRFFLGSTMKFSMFMPRWLSEGVATWSESEFTGQGRLHHPWIKSQTKRVLERKSNCHSRYCFDGPSYYPYGSYAYWVGGFYLKYLEDQKKGTVQCLMHRYSKNLPLFISYRIKRCFGKNFNDSFKDFRKKFVKENETVCPIKSKKLCQKIYKKYRNINWFKGFIDNDKITALVVQPNNKRGPYGGKDGEKIIVYDKERKKLAVRYIDYVIEKIYQLPGKDEIIISFLRRNLEQSDGTSRGFFVYSKGFKKNKLQKKIQLSGKCDELIDFNKPGLICKRYSKNSNWEIVEYVGPDDEEGKVLHSFDQLKNVDIESFSKDEVSYVIRKDFDTKSEVQTQKLKKITKFESPVPQDPKYSFVKYLLPQYVFPGIFIFSNGLTYLTADTSLVDPRSRFTLNLGLSYVLGINDSQNISTPITGYANLGIKLSDKLTLIGTYNKNFVPTGINNNINIFEFFGGGLNLSWSIGDFSIDNGVFFSKNNERDGFLEFLIGQPYSRTITSYSTSLAVSHSTRSINSIYRNFSLSSGFSLKKNKSFNEFYSTNSAVRFGFKWSKSLTHSLVGRYSRLFKNDNKNPVFRDGVIYGGGINSLLEGVSYQHPNYLIGAGSIFGNEMISARTEFDLKIFKIFEGLDFLGTYLETVSLFVGADYINSRNLLYSNSSGLAFESYPNIISGFGGVRTKFNFLYLLPLEVELFAAYSDHFFYSSNTGWLLKSNLTF